VNETLEAVWECGFVGMGCRSARPTYLRIGKLLIIIVLVIVIARDDYEHDYD
jgi:hypothetical protein